MNDAVAAAFTNPLTSAATIIRFVSYLASLVAAGGMLFAAAVHDRRATERGRLTGVITAAAALAVAVTTLGVAVQGALLTGRGVDVLTDGPVLRAVFASQFGTSVLVRLGGLAGLVVAARALWRGWSVAVRLGAAIVVSGSFLLTGHTVEAEPAWLAIASGLAHTAAAAAWFGGVVLLVLTLRARRNDSDPAATARVVGRFSAVATIAVVVVSIAGAARITTLVPLSAASSNSSYGLVLISKALLVGAVLVVGAYNHRYLVPAIRAQHDGAQQRLWTTVRIEAFALISVIALSAVLVTLDPPD